MTTPIHTRKCSAGVVSHVFDRCNQLTCRRGGENLIYDLAGQDATEAFEDIGHSEDARQVLEEHLIGEVDVPAASVSLPGFLFSKLLLIKHY